MIKDDLVSRLSIPKVRLEALSDGVFAIAVTLLVLDLKVPDLPRHVSNAELGHALRQLGPGFLSFVITFVISGAFWFLHQVSFHWIHRIDRALTFINLVFLMFVSLLPFSTAMLGHFPGNPVGMMFYFGNALALSLTLNAHWFYAKKKGLLADHENQEQKLERKLFGQRIMSLPFAFALALGLSMISAQLASVGAFCVLIFQRMRERKALRAAQG